MTIRGAVAALASGTQRAIDPNDAAAPAAAARLSSSRRVGAAACVAARWTSCMSEVRAMRANLRAHAQRRQESPWRNRRGALCRSGQALGLRGHLVADATDELTRDAAARCGDQRPPHVRARRGTRTCRSRPQPRAGAGARTIRRRRRLSSSCCRPRSRVLPLPVPPETKRRRGARPPPDSGTHRQECLTPTQSATIRGNTRTPRPLPGTGKPCLSGAFS
jgi:hypothetical protein